MLCVKVADAGNLKRLWKWFQDFGVHCLCRRRHWRPPVHASWVQTLALRLGFRVHSTYDISLFWVPCRSWRFLCSHYLKVNTLFTSLRLVFSSIPAVTIDSNLVYFFKLCLFFCWILIFLIDIVRVFVWERGWDREGAMASS